MSRVDDERALWLAEQILPHEPALRARLSRRRVGDLGVDDVVQEAYAKLITLSSVEGVRNPKTYLFQVARSVIASSVRGQKVVTIAVSDTDFLDLAADEPSAEVRLSDRQELQRLIEAIALMPEPTRTIFRLRRIEQMPQRRIAETLNMPESTVEKHVSRALTQMSILFGRGGRGRILASNDRARVERNENDAGYGSAD